MIKNYPFVSLDDVCFVNPKVKKIENKDLLISYFKTKEIKANDIYFSPRSVAKDKEVKKQLKGELRKIEENDILVAQLFTSFCKKKFAIMKNLKNKIGKSQCLFCILRVKNEVIPEWIIFTIKQPAFIKQAKFFLLGIAQKYVKIDYISRHTIPLPSLKVQKRIVTETMHEMYNIRMLLKLYKKIKKEKQKEIDFFCLISTLY